MIRTSFKKKKITSLKIISRKCSICHGAGYIPVTDTTAVTCAKCEGKGFVEDSENA